MWEGGGTDGLPFHRPHLTLLSHMLKIVSMEDLVLAYNGGRRGYNQASESIIRHHMPSCLAASMLEIKPLFNKDHDLMSLINFILFYN